MHGETIASYLARRVIGANYRVIVSETIKQKCLSQTTFTPTACHRAGSFKFSFDVSPQYPHEAPKVKCLTQVSIRIRKSEIDTYLIGSTGLVMSRVACLFRNSV